DLGFRARAGKHRDPCLPGWSGAAGGEALRQWLAPLLLAGTALTAAPAWAEEAAGEGSDIVVKGALVAAEQAAWSTTTLSNEDIRKESVSDFDDLLKFVPGMTVRDFGMGGVANAVVIRGFGNGGHGGDLGAVIDGIPLNEAM